MCSVIASHYELFPLFAIVGRGFYHDNSLWIFENEKSLSCDLFYASQKQQVWVIIIEIDIDDLTCLLLL